MGQIQIPWRCGLAQETLDYFSEDGVPLRATIALGITRQDIVFPTEEETGRPGAVSRSGAKSLLLTER